MLITVDIARDLAADWRERFDDEAAFELSWSRYFETATVPDTERLEAWLAKDFAKHQVLHAGIVHEPLLPTHSAYQPTQCQHCGGHGYVRVNVPFDHPNFGKALRCPDCNGGQRSQVVSAPDGDR
jgi:hypothetical protein